jgi:glutathione synthetase
VEFRNTANNIVYMPLGQGKLYVVSEQNTVTLIEWKKQGKKAGTTLTTLTLPEAAELDAITTDPSLNQVYITDENLASLLEIFEDAFREPFVVQRYLPAVREGDKRIILVDGEVVGAINRIPAAGEARSNMHVGGRAEPVGMTERDREICAAIGPTLRERGLIFVGIDVIGEYLTEINVTSPTGIREVKRFGGADIAALVWDAVEARVG